MKKRIKSFQVCLAVLLFVFLHWQGFSQTDYKIASHFEFQAYPTGLIPGIRIEKPISEKSCIHLRLAYNFIRHRDLGEHEDERGDGYGFTLGYKRYFKSEHKGLFLGIKNDIWFNSIDWKDNIGNSGETSGKTDITVIQPTIEFGFAMVSIKNWVFTPSLAFGFEVNAKTDGAPVGEGPILLAGILLGRRF